MNGKYWELLYKEKVTQKYPVQIKVPMPRAHTKEIKYDDIIGTLNEALGPYRDVYIGSSKPSIYIFNAENKKYLSLEPTWRRDK
jgi:DNA replication protein DnaC